MIKGEYNYPTQQTRVKSYLNSPRISGFVNKEEEEMSAMAKVYKMITKLSRQVPTSDRGDAQKIEFLNNATAGSSWSHEPLSRVATHELSIQILYEVLEAALQL